VKIVARNATDFSHGEEGLIIEEWMRHRGFVLIGAAAKDGEADSTMAGN
jgi:hypothetical protein